MVINIKKTSNEREVELNKPKYHEKFNLSSSCKIKLGSSIE